MKKAVLKNFTKFTGKHLCQSLCFNKAQPCNLIKKDAKNTFLQNTSGRLLLQFNFLWISFEFTTPFSVKPIFSNPFHATDLFWYPLKTSENLWFSDVFRGYQKRLVAWNGLISSRGSCEGYLKYKVNSEYRRMSLFD